MSPETARMAKLLGYKRMHGSASQLEFIRDILDPYAMNEWLDPTNGSSLAFTLDVGEGSRTLFSCHIDTVHRSSGHQVVAWDEGTGLFYKSEQGTPDDKECLGADDAAGIWLLLEMIDAGVPGTYIFHQNEEHGGIGSTGMAKHHKSYLENFDRAIAFDRRGTSSVITHQGWGRCCSDDFAAELSEAFMVANTRLAMKPDDTGVFTDTACYVKIIPECTNISSGYESEHGPSEMLDFEYLLDLRQACLKMDWEKLTTVRDPKEVEDFPYGSMFSSSGYTSYYAKDSVLTHKMRNMSYSKLCNWVVNRDPDEVAEVISELCDAIGEMEDEIEYNMHGSMWDEDNKDALDVGMR